MPITRVATGVEICHESLGPDDAPACLLVMGLGAQMIVWPDGLVTELLDRGFRVIRFDNRDVGLSSRSAGPAPDVAALMAAHLGGDQISADYTLSDMAADAAALLDHLGVNRAHVVGASLGGMVAQHMAFEHRHRVASLTSVMSTVDMDLSHVGDEALGALLAPAPVDRDAQIEHNVEMSRVLSGPLFDEELSRSRATEQYDRAFTPAATAFQLAAVGASGDRSEGLASIDCPTLVIHGRADPLILPTGGVATADAIPGADLLLLGRMGHDLPSLYWPQIADAISGVARRAAPD